MRVAAILFAIGWWSVCSAAAGVVAPPVTAVAIAPGGKEIVAGSQAGLKLFSWPDLQPVRTLATLLDQIDDVAFSPDGTLLAVGGGTPSESGTLEVFRWPSGELVHRTRLHDDLICAVAWRPDSGLVATAGADRQVQLSDPSSGKSVRVLQGHSRGVQALAFLGSGSEIATAGIDESLRVWEGQTGKLERTLPNHIGPVNDLALRPSTGGGPPMLSSIGADRTVRLWQPTLGRLMRFVRLKSMPQAVDWTPDGAALVVACQDGCVRVIDPDTVAVLEEIPAISGIAYSLAVAADETVVVGGQNGSIQRVKLQTRN